MGAHANSTEVARFIIDVLERDGLDGKGGPIVSSVNCVYKNINGGKEWRNAARTPNQMIYGQRMVNGKLVSYAVAIDVVAHELFHGLTGKYRPSKYEFESGARNESYSDIFGIIVANYKVQTVDDWDWEMGEQLSATGVPLRDMANPTRFDQPDHMDNYEHLKKEEDHGGVHIRRRIHNKAAYLILNTKNDSGEFEFNPKTVAQLFYLTLTRDLAETLQNLLTADVEWRSGQRRCSETVPTYNENWM